MTQGGGMPEELAMTAGWWQGKMSLHLLRLSSGTTTVMPACLSVMLGLDPSIHANSTRWVFAWMAGSRPAMTVEVLV
jgi:hypothetical protein